MATTFDMDVSTGTFTTALIKNGYIWAGLGVALAIILALYVLRSLGLYLLAKRQNVRKAFLAWIPFVWFYILCKLIGKTRLFSVTYEKVAVWLCLIFAVSEILTIAITLLQYLPLLQYSLIEGGDIYIGSGEQVSDKVKYLLLDGVYVSKRILPFGMTEATIIKVLSILNIFSFLFELVAIIITISAYFAFFRKYLPQHFMLASLLSIFVSPVLPIFIFVCRKKDPIDYNEYIRTRYQGYQNPYNNPYNQGGYNGYSQPKQPDAPFSEFAEKGEVDPGDPFDEFDKKN